MKLHSLFWMLVVINSSWGSTVQVLSRDKGSKSDKIDALDVISESWTMNDKQRVDCMETLHFDGYEREHTSVNEASGQRLLEVHHSFVSPDVLLNDRVFRHRNPVPETG